MRVYELLYKKWLRDRLVSVREVSPADERLQ